MEDSDIFKLWEYYKGLLLKTERPNIKNLIDWLDKSDFKVAPASLQYHNSFKGGLLKHSLDVYYHMYDFKDIIDFFNISEESIIITSLLHDICKVDCYEVAYRNTKNEEGQWIKVPYYTWNEQEPLGHAEKSIMLIYEQGVSLSKIERAMIRNHMGFSIDNCNKRDIGNLFEKYPQSLILHWADELATFTTENTNKNLAINQILTGRNIKESLAFNKQISETNTITLNNQIYKIADDTSIVDNINIGIIQLGLKPIKIYLNSGD